MCIRDSLLAEEKEQLIRTLSHDIRTPLTSIMAYSEFLAGNNDRPAQEQQGYAELIRVCLLYTSMLHVQEMA